jgi:hypothetical protein
VKNNYKNKLIKKMGCFFLLVQFMRHIYLHFGPVFFVKFIFSYKTLLFYILVFYNVETREKLKKQKKKRSFWITIF